MLIFLTWNLFTLSQLDCNEKDWMFYFQGLFFEVEDDTLSVREFVRKSQEKRSSSNFEHLRHEMINEKFCLKTFMTRGTTFCQRRFCARQNIFIISHDGEVRNHDRRSINQEDLLQTILGIFNVFWTFYINTRSS